LKGLNRIEDIIVSMSLDTIMRKIRNYSLLMGSSAIIGSSCTSCKPEPVIPPTQTVEE
jgi:hypothetical protein